MTNCKSAAMEIETEPEIDPLEQYASRITVAGVEDVYKAKTARERTMWTAILILALAAMIFVSCAVFGRYVGRQRVFDDERIFGEIGPFPNISVCVPLFGDKTIAFNIIADWSISEKLQRRMNKTGLTRDDVITFVSNGSAFYITKLDRNSPLTIISMKILDEMRNALSDRFVKVLSAPCDQVLTNCRFYGREFNCCAAAELLAIDHGMCFQMSTQRISSFSNSSHVHGGVSMDPVNMATSGLEFDANFDASTVLYEDDLATEGFIIHVDAMPTALSAPVVVPADADVVIALAPPARINEISECISPDHLPSLARYSYYDPYAVNCFADMIMNNTFFELGCSVPLLSYLPDNETFCDAERNLILMQAVGGQLEEQSKEIAKKINDLRIFARHVFYGNVCPPHCTRWSYPVTTASYGYMRYQEAAERKWSMSRIRIFFPTASYREYTEKPMNLAYLIFCDMGGVWGVYLGVSSISLVQILVYSAVISWFRAKPSRLIGPIERFRV